jgi:DNA-binding CsgD family transcriptional regulator/tetratricopeptide (TPR) repeat protein
VLIGGEAGIGKTALAESLCRAAAERGALMFTGRCYDLTETPPYGPWLDLFARYRPADGLPPLPDAFGERGTIGAVASEAALFQQVQDFLTAAATRQPLVVLLDDLHWADPASLGLLRFIARHADSSALLLIITYRSDEITRRHPLYQLLPMFEREARATRLDLRRLTADAVRALVARYDLPEADRERLVAHLQERAEGNAFFITQLLRALEEGGTLWPDDGRWALGDLARVQVPMPLRQVIDGRLTRLAEETQRLLAVAAVIGQEVPLHIWATVAGADEEALSATVEEGTAAHLIEETPDGAHARFVHALIRETLYEDTSPSRRRRMHRQVGEALVNLPNPDPDAVAYHFQQAGDARAVAWLVAAGDRADRLYSYLTAADRHERALALLGDRGDDTLRGWLLVRLGVLYRQSDLLRGLDYLESAEPLVRAAGDPALAAYWRASRGLVRCLAGRGRAGLPDLKAGVAAIKALPDDALAADALPASIRIALETDGESTYADWLAMIGNLIEARAYGEAMLDARAADAGGTGALPAGDANFGMAMTYAGLGLPDRAREFAQRARDEYRRMGNHNMAVMTSRVLVRFILLPYYPEQRAPFRAAIAEMADDLARMASGGAATPEAIALMARLLDSDSAVVGGNWAETRRAAQALLESGLTSVFLRQLSASLGAIARGQGDRELGWQMVRRTLPQGADYEPGNQAIHIALPMQQLAPALAVDDGDLPTARAWLEAYDRWLAWSGAILGQSEGHALWAEYYRQVGDREQAHEHAERALAHATEPRQPLALLAAHRLLGEIGTATGRFEDAARHLTESLALADACAAPYERALTLLAIAGLHAARGNVEEARVPLDGARATCAQLGAQPALARADALADRLDARGQQTPAFPAGLSAREVEVLRLLAVGRTNREIADALFLSANTVRVHVRNIMTKTDTENRTAAAAFARAHGLI